MGSFAAPLGRLGVEIFGDASDALRAFDQVETASAAMGNALAGNWRDATGRLHDEMGRFATEAGTKFAELGQTMAGVGTALTAGITVPLTGLAALSINAAKDMDSLMRGLTAVTGSSEEAATQMERLKEVAKLPGLGLEEAVQGSIRLQAVGVSATEAERQMKAFGNALATVGKGRADLEAVISQLVQMSTKTNVVAEDLKPIMERVPQVATILKNAFGTIDTEQLAKAGHDTQEVIGAIITGLEKLPPVTGGIGNAFENLSDSSKQSLVAIGNALKPVVEAVIPVLESMVQSVKSIAEWFTGLPAPVQAGVGAVVAFAAALGPLLALAGGLLVAFGSLSAALAPMGLTIAGITATIAPWVLAIGAALAALTALGVWVYQNWEPIVAVINQAWAGILENWTAVWTAVSGYITGVWGTIAGLVDTVWQPVVTFFTTVWDGVNTYFREIWDALSPYITGVWNTIAGAVSTIWEPIATFFSGIWGGIEQYFHTVWDGMAGFLGGVWDAIKTAAFTVWNGIIGVFKDFLEWAKKIPGANKLINLDEAWKSADKLKTSMDKAGTETGKFAGKAKDAAGTPNAPVPKLAKSIEDTGKSAEKTKDKLPPLTNEMQLLHAISDKLKSEHQQLVTKAADLTLQFDKLKGKTTEMLVPFGDLPDSLKIINTELTSMANDKAPGVIAKMTEVKGRTDDLTAALKTLGIQSAADYQTVADKAKLAYDAVLQSPQATQWEKDNALVKVIEAQRAAAVAAGEAIPQEYDEFLADIKTKIDDPNKGLPAQKTSWQNMTTQVSTIMTNFAQDIAKSLFEGDLSFGEKAKGMLKSLGQAVTSTFVEPATTALTNFLNGVLADLIGGKGFGGLKDRIDDVGKTFTSVFGKGGDAEKVSDVVKPPAGAPSGAPGGGAGAAAGSGLAGTVTAISGVATAISSVIGNFQMAGMNKSLDLIEKATRYSEAYLKEILETGVNKWLAKLDTINGWIWETFTPAFTSLMTTTEDIPEKIKKTNDSLRDWLKPVYDDTLGKWKLYEDRLYDITANTFGASMSLDTIKTDIALCKGYLDTMRLNTGAMKDTLTSPNKTWTVTFTGDPIASQVGAEIMRQLRLQGVNLV